MVFMTTLNGGRQPRTISRTPVAKCILGAKALCSLSSNLYMGAASRKAAAAKAIATAPPSPPPPLPPPLPAPARIRPADLPWEFASWCLPNLNGKWNGCWSNCRAGLPSAHIRWRRWWRRASGWVVSCARSCPCTRPSDCQPMCCRRGEAPPPSTALPPRKHATICGKFGRVVPGLASSCHRLTAPRARATDSPTQACLMMRAASVAAVVTISGTSMCRLRLCEFAICSPR